MLDAENLRGGMRELGVPVIGVNVIPQPNTNDIAIADEFYRRIEILKKEIPPDIEASVGYDFSTLRRAGRWRRWRRRC